MLLEQSTTTTLLVKRCLAGDAIAWQQLVDTYARLVHSIPVRHGLSQDEVSDVGQEVFIALAKNLHQLEAPEPRPPWLVASARRFSWRALQKRRREHLGDQSDISDDPAIDNTMSTQVQPLFQTMPSMGELFEGWNRQELLAQAFTRLQARCQTLLRMLFMETSEPSYDEISTELALPKGSIGPTRNRCLQNLRTVLEELGFDQNR